MFVLETFRNFRYMQYACALTASLMFASRTFTSTWSSPALPLIKSGQSPLESVTKEEMSWITSCMMLGSLPGYFLTGYLVETFGRKRILMATSIPIGLPWFFMAYTDSVYVIYAARFITGMMTSITAAACSMYVSETSDEDIRGRATGILSVIGNVAALFVYGVGPFLSYKVLTVSCSILPFTALLLLFFMPESPVFLAKKGKKDQTASTVKTLSPKNITQESLSTNVQKVLKFVEQKEGERSSLFEFFTKKEYRRSLIAMFGLINLQVLSGDLVISNHIQIIIEESGGSISPTTTSVIVGSVRLPAVILLTLLVDKAGRKPLLIISSTGCCLALFGAGTYFYLKNILQLDTSDISWLPAAAVVLHTTMFQFGITMIPQIFLGELFASNIKGVATSFMTFYKATANFFLLKFFLSTGEKFGMHTVFWFFGVCCLLGSIFVFCFVPETKNKSLADIQDKLTSSKKKKITGEQIC